MHIQLLPAEAKDRIIVNNMAHFYAYDMSKYCGFLPGWEIPEDGFYKGRDYSIYWSEAKRYPFIIRVDEELAGFVLVNKIGTTSEVDWNMGEFFVMGKFQGKRIGASIARQVFDQFPGMWEVMCIPENRGAKVFWKKVIDKYTQGDYQESVKECIPPKPSTMWVWRFRSRSRGQ